MAGLGGDDEFVAVAGEIADQDAADVFLGGAGRRAVVVGEIEMGDAAVEGAVHDAAGLLEVIHGAEVVPEAEGNGGQQQAGIAAAPVGHAAVVAGGVEHGMKVAAGACIAKSQVVGASGSAT